jgi:hypothetical protein
MAENGAQSRSSQFGEMECEATGVARTERSIINWRQLNKILDWRASRAEAACFGATAC